MLTDPIALQAAKDCAAKMLEAMTKTEALKEVAACRQRGAAEASGLGTYGHREAGQYNADFWTAVAEAVRSA